MIMKTKNIWLKTGEFFRCLFLLLGMLLLSGVQVNAQLKESVASYKVSEADAMRLRSEGGVIVAQIHEPSYQGRWVQYRKVLRVELTTYDPNTGQKWYNVYYSQVIPSEFQGGHDPNSIRGGWLWLPYNAGVPWKTQSAGSSFVWTLKQGYPVWNPNGQKPDQWLNANRWAIRTAINSAGAAQRRYGYDLHGAVDHDWHFYLRWSQLPPNQLVPGQSFVIDMRADAGGTLQNYHMGLAASINFGGFHIQYIPPPKTAYNTIFVGRPGSGGPIITQDQRRFIFTVPDHPSQEMHLTIILSNWGPVVTYIWEKQPLF